MNNHELLIANAIVSNLGNSGNYGLINGKMGLCIFFFEYSRLTGIDYYNTLAQDMLKNIYARINEELPTDVYDGYAGIGVGLCYLLRRKFVKGNPDKILKSIDKLIFKNTEKVIFNDNTLPTPIFSAGIYLTHRILLKDTQIEKFECSKIVMNELKKWLSNNIGIIDQNFLYSAYSVVNILEVKKLISNKFFNEIKKYFDDLQKKEKDLLPCTSERIWYCFVHQKRIKIDEREVEKFMNKLLYNYPYCINTFNSNIAAIGLYYIIYRH